MTKKQYDFTSFRPHKIEPLVMQISSNWQTPMELKATQIFESLDKKELYKFLCGIIKANVTTYRNDSSSAYKNKIRYFNKLYPNKRNVTYAINQFENQLIKNYTSSNSVFKELSKFKDTPELCSLAVEKEMARISNFISFIDKLLYINDYHIYCPTELKKVGLYEHILPKPVSLKSLFKDPDKYDFTFNALISKNKILKEKINGDLGETELNYIQREKRPEEKNEWRHICALGYLLMKNSLLNTKSKPKITEALNNYFSTSFSRTALKNNFDTFDGLHEPENDQDLDYFKFINRIT